MVQMVPSGESVQLSARSGSTSPLAFISVRLLPVAPQPMVPVNWSG